MQSIIKTASGPEYINNPRSSKDKQNEAKKPGSKVKTDSEFNDSDNATDKDGASDWGDENKKKTQS